MKRLTVSLTVELGDDNEDDRREGQADALVERSEPHAPPEMHIGFRPDYWEDE